MPLDHFSVNVPGAKLEEVIAFLTGSLAHLGFKEMMRPIPTVVGLGDTAPYLWLNGVTVQDVDQKSIDVLLRKTHIAFSAANAEQVRQFHAAALKAGGTCNGPPGLRPEYHPGYYGAFVLDPACGINFEVVSHTGDK